MPGPEDVRREGPGDVGRDGAGHVGVDAEQFRRCLGADDVGDLRAPVATLGDVPGVAQSPHQDDPGIGDVDRAPTGGRGLRRVPVAGHRRDDHVERILRVAAVGGRVGQGSDHVQHLDDRAGPAVRDDQRQGVRVGRPGMDEVDVEAVDLGQELGECVQPRLDPPEVVLVAPVVRQGLHRGEWHALREIGHRFPLGPAGRPQSAAEVVDLGLGDLDPEGPDGVRVARGSIRGRCDLRHPGPPLISAGNADEHYSSPRTAFACPGGLTDGKRPVPDVGSPEMTRYHPRASARSSVDQSD